MLFSGRVGKMEIINKYQQLYHNSSYKQVLISLFIT